jgi:hypothetical protein
VDFLRFNNFFAGDIYADQPCSEKGVINRMEYRPLEGFVFALTPFNFTAIASNLNMSPVLMGNTTIWKPSTTALYSNYLVMQIFREAGLPDGVVNFVPGQGSLMGKVITASPDLGGFHFTGSTATFNYLWGQIGANLAGYKSYPRIVGETGGKDFIFVHPSSPTTEVAAAIVRGAFEYQGQKCSAASRAYIPKSLWGSIRSEIGDMLREVKMGDALCSDRFHLRPRPRGDNDRDGETPLCGRQLLYQRQAYGGCRVAAAFRRFTSFGYQRQGGQRPQPDTLDECAGHQGDACSPDGFPLSVPRREIGDGHVGFQRYQDRIRP